MRPIIKQFNSNDEFYTCERCYIIEMSNMAEDPEVSIARARVKPGITTCWHRLKETSERYLIQKGCGLVEVGDNPPTEVHSGDVVHIPPLCRQRITNTGPNDLIFLAICTPRFLVENYEEIEEG